MVIQVAEAFLSWKRHVQHSSVLSWMTSGFLDYAVTLQQTNLAAFDVERAEIQSRLNPIILGFEFDL